MTNPPLSIETNKISLQLSNLRNDVNNNFKTINKDQKFPFNKRNIPNPTQFSKKVNKKNNVHSLNNAALEMKNLISGFLQNADESEKKVFDIEEELKEIKENKNFIGDFTVIDQDYIFKDDNLNWGRSKTKGTTALNQKKKIRKKKRNNTIHMDIDPDKWKKIKNLVRFKDENKKLNQLTNQKINSESSIDKQKSSNDKFNKKNSVDFYLNLKKKNDFAGVKGENSNNILTKNKLKESLVSLDKKVIDFEKRFSKSIIGNNYNKMEIGQFKNYIDDDNKEGNAKYKRRKTMIQTKIDDILPKNNPNNFPIMKSIGKEKKRSTFNLSTNITHFDLKKEESDIRNFIKLNKANFKEYNNICSDIKQSLILGEVKHESEDENQQEKDEYIIERDMNNIKNNKNKSLSVEDNNLMNESSKNCLVKGKHTINSSIIDVNKTEREENIRIKEMKYRCLIRKNLLVYDSLSDEEIEEEISSSFYIEPKSQFKFYWDMFIFIFSFYSLIDTPYYMAFNIIDKPSLNSLHSISDYFIDAYFLTDLLLGFLTAYYNFEEQKITSINMISFSYLRGWFILDFLSGCPLKSILLINRKTSKRLIHTYVINASNICDLLELCRLIKFFKALFKNNFVSWGCYHIMKFESIRHIITLTLYLIFFLISVHLLACVFIFLGQLDFPNWIYNQGLEMRNKGDIYIASCYFISATVFTVGYGDIISVSIYERSFNLFLLVVGIVIYSWVVTYLSNYFQKDDAKEQEYQKKVAILEQLRVTHEKMPSNLYDKISRFLLFQMRNEKKDKTNILDNLPLSVRNKLIMEMYRDVINNFIFFKYYDNTEFIIKVLLKFRLILAEKNERLVNEGDYLEEIIFVKKGTLSIEIPLPIIIKEEKEKTCKKRTDSNSRRMSKIASNDYHQYLSKAKKSLIETEKPKPTQQYIKIIEIRRNEHFGDILMFLEEKSPLSVKVKSKVAEIFLLNKTEAVEILPSFPKIWRKIMKRSIFNWEQIKILINNSLSSFLKRNHKKMKRGNIGVLKKVKDNKNSKSNEMLNNELELQEIPRDLDDNDSFEGDENILIDEDTQSEDKNDEEEEEEEYEEVEEEGENEEKSVDNEKKAQKIKSIINEREALKEVKEEENEDNEENSSKRENLLIDNINDSYISSSYMSSSLQTPRTNIKNQNINYLETREDDKILNTKMSKNSFSTELISLTQVGTLLYNEEDINKENFPFEPFIDIKENSIIPSIMPINSNNNNSTIGSKSNKIKFKEEYTSLHSNSDAITYTDHNYSYSNANWTNPDHTSYKELDIVHVAGFSLLNNGSMQKHGTIKKLSTKINMKIRKAKSFNDPKVIENLRPKKTIKDQGENEEISNADNTTIRRSKQSRKNMKNLSVSEKKGGLMGINNKLSPKESNNGKKKGETKVLDLISFNIEQNSQNLMNSKTYYSNIFKKVMPELKRAFNENGTKGEE